MRVSRARPLTTCRSSSAQSWERIWLVVKEDYEDAGVEFNLELMDFTTLYKKVDERQFTINELKTGSRR